VALIFGSAWCFCLGEGLDLLDPVEKKSQPRRGGGEAFRTENIYFQHTQAQVI